MYIIRPKHTVDIGHDVPYFYLIGPVLGGGDWQHEMCLALHRRVGECFIATPNRWDGAHSLKNYFVGLLSEKYTSQTHWEQEHIEHAIRGPKTCVVAYLAEESIPNPQHDGRPYSIDTYGEMNYFRGRIESLPKRARTRFPLVLGVNERYSYWKTLKKNLDYSYGDEFPYCHSIGVLADRATEMVFRK